MPSSHLCDLAVWRSASPCRCVNSWKRLCVFVNECVGLRNMSPGVFWGPWEAKWPQMGLRSRKKKETKGGRGKKQMGLRPPNHHHPGVCFFPHLWFIPGSWICLLLLYEDLTGISCCCRVWCAAGIIKRDCSTFIDDSSLVLLCVCLHVVAEDLDKVHVVLFT